MNRVSAHFFGLLQPPGSDVLGTVDRGPSGLWCLQKGDSVQPLDFGNILEPDAVT
jgi:hypothetical protein